MDGLTFVALDQKYDEHFAARKLKKLYRFNNTIAFKFYNLVISSPAVPLSRLEITEIQFYECGPKHHWELGPFIK
jgi:hypothetical protein